MYQRKVDVDMLNAVKSIRTAFGISTSTLRWYNRRRPKLVLTGTRILLYIVQAEFFLSLKIALSNFLWGSEQSKANLTVKAHVKTAKFKSF